MRITTGLYKNMRLNVPEGRDIRPTSDKIRQAVFNTLLSLNGGLSELYVMDVFCGTGALGIEALSRGAKNCVFVDIDTSCAKSNVSKVEGHKIMRANAHKLPARSDILPPRDLIFMDPPYNQDMVLPTLQSLIDGNWLADDAIIVIEEENIPTIWPANFTVLKTKEYGRTQIVFIKA